MKYIIGIDVGTTATKGVLYDENGQKVASAQRGYPLIQEKMDQAEEDPKLIFDAVQDVIFSLSQKRKITAISWSSQMHSLIGLDENKELLTNSLTWADNRAKNVVKKAKADGLAQKIYQQTGMPIHPMAPVYKLFWLKQEKPKIFSRVKYWLGIKEYLIYRLTGKLVEDLSMAAGTGLLNLKTLTWDQELLSQVGITEKVLPKLVKSSDIVGSVKEEYRQKLDLDENTKVIAGASDGYLSTIGVGAIDEADFAMNVGTSGGVRCLAKKSIIDKKAQFFCYPADQGYLIGGPVNNGGIVFEWARKVLLGPNESAEDFLTLAQSAPVGSRGLIFHPYLGGERAPIWDANARGSFVGLTRSHTKAEMARSVIEGIIFNLYDASHAIIQSAGKPHAIRITGGFVQSDFVRQMLADVYNLPIIAMKNSEGGTLAAMFLGKPALGLSPDLSGIRKFTSEEKVYFPNPENVVRYQKILPVYREIENDLAKSYEKLAYLQNKLQ